MKVQAIIHFMNDDEWQSGEHTSIASAWAELMQYTAQDPEYDPENVQFWIVMPVDE